MEIELQEFDQSKEMVDYLTNELSSNKITPIQFNLMSTLIATCENNVFTATSLLLSVRNAVSDKKWDIDNHNEKLKREKWISEIAIGTRVHIPVNNRRRGRTFRNGAITKIYNGKNGTVYTVHVDQPYWGPSYKSKAQQNFKVMASDLEQVNE